MEEQKPTIADPFGDRSGKPTNKRIFIKAPKPPREEKSAVSPPYPNFYISQASKRLIAQQISEKSIVEEELPTIYKLALLISNVFKRDVPTLSDVEIAIKIRTYEEAVRIASGEKELDIIRHELRSQEIMPKKQRIEMWKIVATQIVELWETT